MPAESNHPVFTAPANSNVKIWRYMDLSKYVSLLDSSALYFSRADMLGDPYEGATSHLNRELWPQIYQDKIPISVLEKAALYNKYQRQWTFINCWHMNDHESAAMWKLYTQTCEAVAIRSTYSRLHYELPPRTFVGIVEYMDYTKEWMPEGNAFYRFMRKRKSFQHEQELRALIQDLPSRPDPDGGPHQVDTLEENKAYGRLVPIRLSGLVERVFVAPTAPTWFLEIVRRITSKYGLDVVVEQSLLDTTPVF